MAILLAVWLGSVAVAAQPRLGVETEALIGAPAGRPLSGEALDRATEELSSKMRCPVCQGLSVADSPTDSALAMKAEVREFFAAGYTRQQILDYFEGAYGEFIRLEPKGKGFNLTVWVAPVLALLLGIALIATRVRKRHAAEPTAGASADAEDLAGYVERVRREVGR